MNYTAISQNAEEVGNIQNAPSVSMGQYLISSEQTRLLTTLSVYSLRGNSREQGQATLYERECTTHLDGHGQAAEHRGRKPSPTARGSALVLCAFQRVNIERLPLSPGGVG